MAQRASYIGIVLTALISVQPALATPINSAILFEGRAGTELVQSDDNKINLAGVRTSSVVADAQATGAVASLVSANSPIVLQLRGVQATDSIKDTGTITQNTNGGLFQIVDVSTSSVLLSATIGIGALVTDAGVLYFRSNDLEVTYGSAQEFFSDDVALELLHQFQLEEQTTTSTQQVLLGYEQSLVGYREVCNSPSGCSRGPTVTSATQVSKFSFLSSTIRPALPPYTMEPIYESTPIYGTNTTQEKIGYTFSADFSSGVISGFFTPQHNPEPIPEPSSMLLLASAFAVTRKASLAKMSAKSSASK